MKKWILRVFICLAVMSICFAGGFLLARQIAPTQDVILGNLEGGSLVELADTLDVDMEFIDISDIVVINMDSGTYIDGSYYNFGQELIVSAAPHIDFVSLEIARMDMVNNLIGAYIVIPASFSEDIQSINYQMNQTEIEYRINPYISLPFREIVLEELRTITNLMNQNLSHMYMSAIVRSMHTVQDQAMLIMDNDERDMETLEDINVAEIIAMVEIPTLIVTDTSGIPRPNWGESFGNQAALMGNMQGIFGNSLAAGQEEINNVLQQSLQVNITLNEIRTDFDEIVVELFELEIDPGEEADFDYDHAALLSGIMTVLGQYSNYIEGVIVDANASISELRGMVIDLNVFVDSVPPWYHDAADVGNAHADLSSPPAEATDWTVADWAAFIDSIWATHNLMSPTQFPGTTKNESQVDYVTDPVRLDEGVVLVPGEDPVVITGVVSNNVDDIIDDAERVRDHLLGVINTANEDIDRELEELEQELRDISDELAILQGSTSSVTSNTGAINLGSLVDTEGLGGITSQKVESQANLQSDITDMMMGYQEAMSDGFRDATENINNMRNSMMDTNNITRSNLEYTLANVQLLRTETSNSNREALLEITGQLPHLRHGDTINEVLLRYMTNPIIVQDRSEARTPREALPLAGGEQTEITPVANQWQVPRMMLWAMGILIVLAVIGGILKKILGIADKDEDI
jgi:hypothetical protein